MVLTEEQKQSIINKYKLNWTIKKISENMNLNKNTVHLWIKRYKQDQSLERKVGSGIRIRDQNIQ
jgi:transposase-like protein